MKKILITGVAGSGKTSVVNELVARGYEACDIEEIEGMFDMFRKDTGQRYEGFTNADPEMVKNANWLCDVEKLKTVLASQKSDIAFYGGVASNMDDIIPLFDSMIVLQKTPVLLVEQLKNREGTDDMGSTESSREAVLGWKDWWEDEMKEKGGILLPADAPVKDIAGTILTTVGAG